MSAKRQQKSRQKAYFQDHFTVPKPLSDAIWALMLDRRLKSYQIAAVLQVIVSLLIQHKHGEDAGLVPIPATAFKKYARGANRRTLAGELKTPGVYHGNYCLRWEPGDHYKEVVDRFLLKPDREFYERYSLVPKVNLINGRKCSKIERTRLRDESGNLLDHQWLDTMRVMAGVRVRFDFDAVVEHLMHRHAVWQARLAEYGEENEKTKRAELRFLNDHLCFLAVLNQDARHWSGQYWTYQPAYFQARTGRAVHIKGGFQSCSKRMKMVAFSNIKDLRNYDLVSSQINCAIVEFRLAGISTRWLKAYRDNPDAKAEYARAARLPMKVWKKVLLALLIGGNMPRSAEEKLDEKGNPVARGEVFKALKKVAEKGGRDLQEVIDTVRAVVGELVENLEGWHAYLFSTYWDKVKQRGHQGRWYITNLVNRKLYRADLFESREGEKKNLTKSEKIARAKSRIASFLLQGREAAFIFTLTQISPRFGFTVLTNEYDGLIVMGEIPREAIEVAAQASGLGEVRFEEKEFEDDAPDDEDED